MLSSAARTGGSNVLKQGQKRHPGGFRRLRRGSTAAPAWRTQAIVESGALMMPRLSHACLAALVALALLGACKKAPTGPAAGAPVEVGVITVALRDVPVTFEYVGQTQSSQQVRSARA